MPVRKKPETPAHSQPPNAGRRQMIVTIAGLALAFGFYWVMQRAGSGDLDFITLPFGSNPALLVDDSFIAERASYIPLDGVDERRTREQREFADDLARRHIGTPLTAGHSLDDLRVIQEILDKRVLKPDQTYELQALGVALGDVLAQQHGLQWTIVEDEIGRSRALRFRDTENVVFPVTMISKRVEGGLRFRVRSVYDEAVATLSALAREADSSRSATR